MKSPEELAKITASYYKNQENKTGYRTAAQQLSEMSDTSLLDEYYLGRRSIFFVQDVKTEIDNRLSKINIHELRDFINIPSCTDWPLELLYEEMTNRATKSNSAVQPSFDPEQALIQLVQLCSFDKHILVQAKENIPGFNAWLVETKAKQEQLKQQALSKLTDEEKKALGLL